MHSLTYWSKKALSVVAFWNTIFISSLSKLAEKLYPSHIYLLIVSKLSLDSLLSNTLSSLTVLLNLSVSLIYCYYFSTLFFLWGKSRRAMFVGLSLLEFLSDIIRSIVYTFLLFSLSWFLALLFIIAP